MSVQISQELALLKLRRFWQRNPSNSLKMVKIWEKYWQVLTIENRKGLMHEFGLDTEENEPHMIWRVGTQCFACKVLCRTCLSCGQTRTLVALPGPVLLQMDDGTNVVCHRDLGGCDQGYVFGVAPGKHLWTELG